VRTSVLCRGKPSTGYERWLVLDAGRNTETHKTNVDGKFFTNVTTLTAGPGSAKAKVAETFAKHALPMGIDFHFSKTPNFALSGSTLKQSGYGNQYTMADGDSGDTYYGATVPWQWNAQRKLYGAKSEEFTVSPGYLLPKHIHPERFRIELPPNGSFEGFDREEGSGVPPDNWEMGAAGVWNTDAAMGPAKGGADPKDGARYLRFLNTNLATAVRSKWFPVRGLNVYDLSFWIHRTSIANTVAVDLEWVKFDKSAISTDSFTMVGSSLVDSAWNFRNKAWTSPATAAFCRVVARKTTANTDQFHLDGVRLEDLGAPWRYIGDAGEPTFQNSWVNFDAANQRKAGFRVGLGYAELCGLIKNGTTGGAVIFTLPAVAWPPKPVRFAVESNGAFGFVEIGASGDLKLWTGVNNEVDLSPCRWPTFL